MALFYLQIDSPCSTHGDVEVGEAPSLNDLPSISEAVVRAVMGDCWGWGTVTQTLEAMKTLGHL